MDRRKTCNALFFLLIFLSVLYFSLLVIGMVLYSGGTMFDANTTGYRFFENYLSDLGRIMALDGCSNLVPYRCFVVGILYSGLVSACLFILMTICFHNFQKLKGSSIVALIFGLLSSIACMSIGFMPLDVNVHLHRLYTSIFGVFLIPTHLIFGIMILKDKSYSNFYGWWYIGSGTIIGIFCIIVFSLGFDGNYLVEVIKIVGQKFVLLIVVFGTTLVQSFGVKKHMLGQKMDGYDVNNESLVEELIRT